MEPAANVPVSTYVHVREDGFYFSQGPTRLDLAAQNLTNVEKILSKNIPYSKAKLKQDKETGKVLNNAEIMNKLMESAKSNKELLFQNYSSATGLDRFWTNLTGKERDVTNLFNRIQSLNSDYRPFSYDQNQMVTETIRMGWLAKNPENIISIMGVSPDPVDIYDAIDFHNDGKNALADLVREGIIDKNDLVRVKSGKLNSTGSMQDVDFLETVRKVREKIFDKRLSKEDLSKLEKLRDAYLKENHTNKIQLIGLLYGFGTEVFDVPLIDVAKKNNATMSFEILERYRANSVKIAREIGWKEEDKDALSFICHLKETLKDLQKSGFFKNKLGIDEVNWFTLEDHRLPSTIRSIKNFIHPYDYDTSEQNKLETIRHNKAEEYVQNGNFKGIVTLGLLLGFNYLYSSIISFNAVVEKLNDDVDVNVQRELLSSFIASIPVKQIIENSSPKVIELLLDHHLIDVGKEGSTIVNRIYSNNLSSPQSNENYSWKTVLDKLSDQGVDFNKVTIYGDPLIFALFSPLAVSNKKELLNYMLDKKINLEAKNSKGETVLTNTLKGYFYTPQDVIFLLDQGVQVHYKDPLGSSPLILSINSLNQTVRDYELWLSVVKKIIDAGADINEDKTQIMNLLQKSEFRVIGNLLEWGFDPEAKGSDGRSLMDIAVEKGRLTFVKQLIRAGSAVSPNYKVILLESARKREDNELIALLQTDKLR